MNRYVISFDDVANNHVVAYLLNNCDDDFVLRFKEMLISLGFNVISFYSNVVLKSDSDD